MNPATALHGVLRFLQVTAGFLFVGTIAELWMMKHYDGTMQLVPFAMCVIGLIAVVVAGIQQRPKPEMVIAILMVVIGLSSLIGMWEHIEGNLGFITEVRPNASTGDKVRAVLQGRAPLLAPGILALAASMEIAALMTRSRVRSEVHRTLP